jgi:hypothetical protein
MSTSKNVRKFFLCSGECVPGEELGNYPGSHIIGELRYLMDDGETVTALAIYEVSSTSNIIPSTNVHVRVEIIGDARGIRCTSCHRQFKRWEMGKVAVRQLLQRYQRAML